MFSFANVTNMSKTERRIVKLSKSEPFKPPARPPGTVYEIFYESEAIEDNPNLTPSRIATVACLKDHDCKLQVSVFFSSQKTWGKELFLCGTTVSLREMLKNMKSGIFEAPIISEYCVGAKLFVEVMPLFPKLLTVPSLGINCSRSRYNPLMEKFVFYNEDDISTPKVDIQEISLEPRLAFRIPNIFVQNVMTALQRSIDGWKKRFHIERMRQGYFFDCAEAFNHGWHYIEVTVHSAKMSFKSDVTSDKPVENRKNVILSTISAVSDDVDLFSAYSEAPPTPIATPEGSSRRSSLGMRSAEKTRKIDDFYPVSFASITIKDRNLQFSNFLGRTNTEYYTCDPIYGSNINSAIAKKTPQKSVEFASNTFTFSTTKEAAFAVVSSQFEESIKNSQFEVLSSKVEETKFCKFIPSLAADLEVEIFVEELLGTRYPTPVSIGTVFLNLSGSNLPMNSFACPVILNPEFASKFDTVEVNLSIATFSSVHDFQTLRSNVVNPRATEYLNVFVDAIPSASFLAPSTLSNVYIYDHAQSGERSNHINSSIVRLDESPNGQTSRFTYAVNGNHIISECYEWLWSLGYNGVDPLAYFKNFSSSGSPRNPLVTFIGECVEEAEKFRVDKLKEKDLGSPSCDVINYRRIDATYPLSRIKEVVHHLENYVNECIEIQVEAQGLVREGMTFRPSVMKKELKVQMFPLDLHYQFMVIRKHVPTLPSQLNVPTKVDVESIVTCGAFSPHGLGHKKGGLSLQEQGLSSLKYEIDNLKQKFLAETSMTGSDGVPCRSTSCVAPTILSHQHPASSTLQQLGQKVSDYDLLGIHIAQRRIFALSQILSTVTNSFMMKLAMVVEGQIPHSVSEKWIDTGFLCIFQGLLSTSGNEKSMLEDSFSVVESLKLYQIRLFLEAENWDNNAPSALETEDYDIEDRPGTFSTFSTAIRRDIGNERGKTHVFIKGREIHLYLQEETCAKLSERYQELLSRNSGITINLHAFLFSMGIDMQQTMSTTFNDYGRIYQDEINLVSFNGLNNYCHLAEPITGRSNEKEHPLSVSLRRAIQNNKSSKNVNLIMEVQRVAMLLHACMVVFCKSGKDRTGMVVTYRQAQTLCENYGCGSLESQDHAISIANIMRQYGTRIRVCEKNIGKPVFSINMIQSQFLPVIYRPPSSVSEDILKKDNS